MPPVRHLPNAPIREALLDVRVELPAEFSAVVFKDLKEEVGPSYPKMIEGSKFHANLQFEAGGNVSTDSVEHGLHAVHFISADEKTVAQFRADGFTLNKLRPYTEWESIFPEAMRLWTVFSRVALPTSVSRIALRYINEFLVPAPLAGLGRYFPSVPDAPQGSPGRARGFLSRVLTEDELSKRASVVTHSVNETVGSSQSQVILDIDVSCGAVPGMSPESLGDLFAKLRETKNAIFFNSLTEETLRFFQ